MGRNNIEPRMLPVEDALLYVGFSASTFSRHRATLEKELHFPKPHPVVGKFSRPKYDKKLLDKWLDETSGIETSETQIENMLLERIQNGKI